MKIQALPKDLVASKPHLAALMEVPEHRPYVRTPRASARPSREASPDRPMSSLSWFLPTPSGPAASGLTPEALMEGVFQSPKLVSTLGGADDDDVTDIQVPVPTPTPPPPSSHPSSATAAPVTEIKVVYAATREDGGVKPKKRPEQISGSPVSKKQKSNSPEGGSTTVMQVLQTSTQMQTPPTTVISTQASAVTLPSASVVQPLVVSPATTTTTAAAGATRQSSRPFSPHQAAANYATEIVSDSPPRDISDDKV